MIKEKIDLEALQIDADALIEKITGFKKWVLTFKQMHEDKYGKAEGFTDKNDPIEGCYECQRYGGICSYHGEQNFAVKSNEATEEEILESNRQIQNDKN